MALSDSKEGNLKSLSHQLTTGFLDYFVSQQYIWASPPPTRMAEFLLIIRNIYPMKIYVAIISRVYIASSENITFFNVDSLIA